MKQFLDFHQKNVLGKNMPNLFLKSSLMFDWLLWFGVEPWFLVISVLDSHPLLSAFQLMLLEHIIMCRLIMGNKTLAIQEVNTRLCTVNLWWYASIIWQYLSHIWWLIIVYLYLYYLLRWTQRMALKYISSSVFSLKHVNFLFLIVFRSAYTLYLQTIT